MNPHESRTTQLRFQARILAELDGFEPPPGATAAQVVAAIREFIAGLEPEKLIAPVDLGGGVV